MFTEREGCEQPESCRLLGRCMRAMVINTEFKYEQKGMQGNALDLTIRNAKCGGEEVDNTVSRVRQYRLQSARRRPTPVNLKPRVVASPAGS